MRITEAPSALAGRVGRRWRLAVDWARRHLPARGVDVACRMGSAAKADRLGGLAAEVAFFAVLSIFPAFLAMAAALGSLQSLIGGDFAREAEQRVVDFVQTFLTNRAEGTVEAVRDLFRKQSGGVFTFGVAVALWSASRGMRVVLRTIGEINDVEETRSGARRALVAVGLVLCSLVATAVMLAMIVLGPLLGRGQALARAWGVGELYLTLWQWLRLPVAFLVLLAWATLILHSAPHRCRGWRLDAAGALVTGVLSLVASLAFRLYLDLFGGNPVFGVLGSALVVLVWFYLLSAALLIGAELNAVLAEPPDSSTGGTDRLRPVTDHPAVPGTRAERVRDAAAG